MRKSRKGSCSWWNIFTRARKLTISLIELKYWYIRRRNFSNKKVGKNFSGKKYDYQQDIFRHHANWWSSYWIDQFDCRVTLRLSICLRSSIHSGVHHTSGERPIKLMMLKKKVLFDKNYIHIGNIGGDFVDWMRSKGGLWTLMLTTSDAQCSQYFIETRS